MNQTESGQRVWQQDAPVLFGQIKGKLLAGDATVTLDDARYSVIRDSDERGDRYVLTPES